MTDFDILFKKFISILNSLDRKKLNSEQVQVLKNHWWKAGTKELSQHVNTLQGTKKCRICKQVYYAFIKCPQCYPLSAIPLALK